MATVDGIWSPDEGTDFDLVAALGAMATSIAASIAAKVTPAGSIISYAGASAPTGWLLCQGQAVSRVTYADLFDAIGTTFGAGDGSSTFNLPNLKGRAPVGVDAAQTEFTPLGKTGGAKTHALTVDEIPAHRHQFGSDDMVATQGGYSRVGNYFSYDAVSTASGGGSHVLTVKLYDNSGTLKTGDQPHNNLQPYLAVNFLIKV